MSIIKQANDSLEAKDDVVKQAVLEMERMSPKDDMAKIADHWRTQGKDLDLNDLRARISTELEMLEYSPADVATMTGSILGMLGKQL